MQQDPVLINTLPSRIRHAVADSLAAAGYPAVPVVDVHPCLGGSINSTFKLTLADGSRFFLKTHPAPLPDMFILEHQALGLLAEASPLKTPIAVASTRDFLLTEWVDFGPPSANWQEAMGQGLALLHQARPCTLYGFEADNYLGLSRQPNRWQSSWLEFWRDQRLGHQMRQLAKQTDNSDRLIRQLQKLDTRLEHFLGGISETAALLHGDLWSGNAAADSTGKPLIFDPASYFGHREAEFGMMRLFGGFGPRCEQAYAEVWPFDPGSEERIAIYRLYHLVNHLLLFGAAYYHPCLECVGTLL